MLHTSTAADPGLPELTANAWLCEAATYSSRQTCGIVSIIWVMSWVLLTTRVCRLAGASA